MKRHTTTSFTGQVIWTIDGHLDPDKGLLIWGDIRHGKSTMLKIIREFCFLV
ncbi:hypothetical protein [Duncaniella dubosii]|uniref:hypothetical protein n=1 Tax=Duncaniella dubosii TaxID=2518971 RepID=UPI003F6772FD